MKLGRDGDRADRLVERAREVGRNIRCEGCTIWACQIEPLLSALADELERTQRRLRAAQAKWGAR
jgi:hypothetical protein